MTDISKLAGIAPSEANRLRSKGRESAADSELETISDLWARVGENPDHGIHELARLKGIQRDRLIALLAGQGEREADTRDHPWIKRHGLGVALILSAPILCLMMLASCAVLPPPVGYGGLMAKQVVVRAARGLPAFHLIDVNEVAEVITPKLPKAIDSQHGAVGRYTLAPISSGTTLVTDQVSAACPPNDAATGSPQSAASPADYQILSVPLKPGALGDVRPGACVSLLVAPRERAEGTPEGRSLNNVTVLAADRGSDSTSVVIAAAISRDDKVLESLLGKSDVFFLHPAR